MTIKYALDDLNKTLFDVDNLDDLKSSIEKMFSFKGLKPTVEIKDGSVVIEIDDNTILNVLKDYNKATRLAEKGKLDLALELFQKVVEKCPLHAESYRNIAQIKMLKKDYDGAIDTLIEALRINPNHLTSLILMGNIYVKSKNDIDTADIFYRKALELDPNNNITTNNIAANFLSKGDIKRGKELLLKAYNLNKNYPNTLYGLAVVSRQEGNFTDAFNYAFEAAKLKVGAENPDLRSEILKILILSANEIAKTFDSKTFLTKIVSNLQVMADEKIRIEPSNEISVNAKLEYSVAHKRDHTVIKYKSGAKNIAHYILHELMHLEMILSASKSDRNYFCVPNQESYPEFEEIFNGYFDEVNKLKRDTVIRNLFDGLNSQIFNNPIDLFVEDKIFNEYPIFRPLQLISLFDQEQENITATTDPKIVNIMPYKIVSKSKVLNIVTSLHLKELYTMDFVKYFSPDKNEYTLAKRLYDEYLKCRNNFKPGDEYLLLQSFAKQLRLGKNFKLLNQTELFPADSQDSKNASIDYNKEAILSYMVDAIKFFRTKSTADIKNIAIEIAKIGIGGINPNNKSGYIVPSIPNKDFGGNMLLAYYYVSWAIAIPEMVDKLNLPFKGLYDDAKKIADSNGK